MFGLLGEDDPATGCGCRTDRHDTTLRIDASDCPGRGDLAASSGCRQTAIDAIGGASLERIQVRADGKRHLYTGQAVDVLNAAARFATRASRRDSRLATTAKRDPLQAAEEAAGRAGLVGELATDTGLAPLARRDSAYESLLQPRTAPSVAASQVDPHPPPDGTVRTARVLDTGASVRLYDRPEEPPIYHLEPLEYTLDAAATAVLEAAAKRLAEPPSETGVSDPYRAVASVAESDVPIDTLAQVLEKHTSGLGIFEDLFSDESVAEVFVNAPAASNTLHVRAAGEEFRTNVHLTDRGAARLAAKLRAETGRAFSKAAPTIDATLSDVGEAAAVRVAGVREPASDGLAFALRAEATDQWRLSRLVANGTLSAPAAGLLSLAMTRGASVLVAGPRGAGKTTMASALLWELAPATRLLAIEDTPELPVDALQRAGRDVQRLEAASGTGNAIDPATALRTALRMGDGALAVGEVRGEEARVLYEAMRVGAASDTVIGTIHGDGYDGVRERVVSDLGVPESSFAATDLLVTLAPVEDGKRVTAIEEVTEDGGATLYELGPEGLTDTDRIARGNSRLMADLTRPEGTYSETLRALQDRTTQLEPSLLLQNSSGGSQSEGLHG